MKIEIDLEEFAEQVRNGQSVTAKGGVLNDLLKQLTEMTLQAEIESHLAQDLEKNRNEAINAIFPNTEIQLCIVHQIQNSLKYVASKNQKQFASELKTVYQAFTKEEAEAALDKLEEKWGKKYPIVFDSW